MVVIYTFASRGSLYMQYEHEHMLGGRDSEKPNACVSKTLLLFQDYTFNLHMRKRRQANN